ncbi:protein-export membrane protein SecD [Wolbachia pipientis]|uniref:Protein translocase subunit SecD n=1 Tax=Wolbachia pipientis TaxID=955 RepID=A0A1E7QKK6_WOLPI|nr:protein translocase subunit SecD [Wolbachia pipientis]OEY87011.1 protein-export membrane protein SecD [Wolbachia pipientis]
MKRSYSLVIKSVLILLLLLISLYVVLPNFVDSKLFVSKKRINLGLDLKGGASLLLDVDLDFYFKEKLGIIANELQGVLLAKNIKCKVQNDSEFVIVILDRDYDITKLINQIDQALELHKIDSKILITYKPHSKNSLIDSVIKNSIYNVHRRMDELGTKEVSVQKQGQNKILIQMPGAESTEQVKSLLGKTAKLSFHLLDERAKRIQDIDHETTVLLQDAFGNFYHVLRKTEIGGDALINASVRFGNLNEIGVHFKFNKIASEKFAKITRENVGRPFAIVLDNTVLTAPIIREPMINGEGQISGHFTEKQANELAVLLRSGALLAPLKVVEEKNIGPSLGKQSIQAGEIASVISIIAVSLFIIITYGKLGVLASIGLLFNVVLILLILTLLESTLTLPGITGIALTVGMAVDANVLIFERIREEIKSGKRVIRAIEEGFRNAVRTILDSNITTLIAAGIMFVIGSGAIRGFSVTLSIGIICSMFSAITVTKLLIDLFIDPQKLTL